MNREDERRLMAVALRARRSAYSLGVVLICVGAPIAIAASAIGGTAVLATGAGLLRFAGSPP